MTWHLKDRELEQKLIDIDCDFLEDLNNVVKDYLDDVGLNTPDEKEVITVGFYQNHLDELGELYFFLSDLEEIPDYNPNDWNNFPEIIPPFDSIMRLEFEDGTTGRKFYYAAFYTSNGWRSAVENGLPKFVLTDGMIESGLIKNVRFRPWED